MKRQVPENSYPIYALIGSGALARHWAYYLENEGVSFVQWARKPLKKFNTFLEKPFLEDFENLEKDFKNLESKPHRIKGLKGKERVSKEKFKKEREEREEREEENLYAAQKRLKKTVEFSSHILLLISDQAISSFLKQYPFLYQKVLIHCSGALTLPGVHGVHPLMSFTHSLFKKSFYEKIFFVTEDGKASFSTLFPDLKNLSCSIRQNSKPLYHSYLALSGNLSSFLWGKIIQQMKLEWGIPEEALYNYLEGISMNLKKNGLKALTGPLVRGETQVIEKHKKVLKGNAFEALYHAFLNSYFHFLNPAPKEEKS